MKMTQSVLTTDNLERITPDLGSSNMHRINTFQSSNRHTDVSPQDLSGRCGISIKTTINTLTKTTQKFLRNAVLPLSQRYRTDKVFQRKTLAGDWSPNTIDG